MLRRQRPGGGRHPPPLTPTVSNFKPRAQWNNSGSSILLYVNLPGFYRDQIEIKKDEKTRAIYIQGQRPLSTQTKARFNEVYRVPESCDMTKLNTSFSHGLLTIEFPAVVEGEKAEKAGNDQGKTVQRPNSEGNRGAGLSGSSLGQNKPLDMEKHVGRSQEKAVTMANKEEPITYKSVVEGKRAVPAANQVKTEQKVASPILGPKEHARQEKVVEKKQAAQIGQQKTVQKIKEEEARNTLTVGGSLKAKVPAKEEKAIERKKEADIGQEKIGEKVNEEGSTRTPIIGGSLELKVHSKEEKLERKGEGKIGQKLKQEGKIGLGENKEKMIERITQDGNGNVISKQDNKDEKVVGYKVSEGGIQERVEEKKIEEAGLAKETRDQKDKPKVMEPRRVDSDLKEDLTKGREDREKLTEKSSESENDTLLVEEQRKAIMGTPAGEGRSHEEEGRQTYDTSLVNVGVASLVIMGFGAYVFVPLVKMFY
ncbi:SHSP domain-containing protein [Hirschfeldia incana]|nr:SHSP domain-containing protein [Hirschfeldia incana]